MAASPPPRERNAHVAWLSTKTQVSRQRAGPRARSLLRNCPKPSCAARSRAPGPGRSGCGVSVRVALRRDEGRDLVEAAPVAEGPEAGVGDPHRPRARGVVVAHRGDVVIDGVAAIPW